MVTHEQAIHRLRETLGAMTHDSPDEQSRMGAQIRDAKEGVITKYAPMFSTPDVDKLTANDFKGFLLFRNNNHWDSLHRGGGWMTEDMTRLREALKLLVDESLSLQTRLNRLRPPGGDPMVKGLGRAVITAILQMLHPDKYGVWNNTAEGGMKALGLWPEIPRGTSFGERYETMNRVLLDTASELGTDLWTLDMLWWRVQRSPTAPTAEEKEPYVPPLVPDGSFVLEEHLHEFLVANWEATELSRNWALLEDEGDIVGSYYNTGEVGEIDLLAKHRKKDRWLVIELKRSQTSDQTVGQVLRYMGWVRRKLAAGGDVEGLIICQEIDKRIQYALDAQPSIRCMTYQVQFNLNLAPQL